jgi:uncharacterized protein YndB with AHSA1/START domain
MSEDIQQDYGVFQDGRRVRFERVLPATVERTWDHLTKPDLLRKWLAVVDKELLLGDAIEFRILLAEDQPSSTVLHGKVVELEARRRLSFSWDDPRTPNETINTFDLSARGASCRLTLVQQGISDGALAHSAAGWHVFLGRLEDALRGASSPAFSDTYNRVLAVYDEGAVSVTRQVRGRVTTTRDVIIQVQSLEAATRFYGEVLGLDVAMRQEGLVGFETGSFRLYVERGASQGPVFELLVPDLDAAKEKLLARGCEVVDENPDIPRCYVRDNFGMVWNLAER